MPTNTLLNRTLFLAALSAANLALATNEELAEFDDSIEIYTQTELLDMQGQSALDIIEQVAGFQFVNSNSQRGLSNAAGNVLINGLPVLSKSQSLEDVLADIPVSQLAEMEVYLSGHPFTSASQYTQVINLIRDTSQNQLSWRVGAKSHSNFHQPNALSLQTSVKWQQWDHQLQLNSEKDRIQSTTDYSELNASNTPYLNGREKYQETIHNANVGIVSSKTLEHSQLQLNGQYLREKYRENYQRNWQQQDEPNGLETIKDTSTLNEVELGFDWQQQATKPNQAWLWQVTGLLRHSDSKQNALSTQSTGNDKTSDTFKQHQSKTEQVIKFASQKPSVWWQPELGFELSRNRLDADTVEQSSISTQVRETRAEPFIASKIELNEQWQLYSKLTAEYAKLSSEAKASYETQSRYLKPLIKLSHQADNGILSTFTLQRKVEQLNFADFLDSQDNDFGREQSGNTQLNPQQSVELSYELNYESDVSWAVNSRLFWQKQRDIHEFVRFANNTWGVANAGHAYYYGWDLDLTLQTNWLLTDSQINVFYEYRDAHYDDPLTGSRAISWVEPHSAEIEFRKDGDGFAWGLVFALPDTETAYYPEEVYRQKDRAISSLYTEFSLKHELQLNIELNDMFGGEYIYDRHIFTPDRNGKLDYRYYAYEHNDPSLVISLSGEF